MLQTQSRLRVADNTGAKELYLFRVMGSTRKRFASIGDLVKCSVREAIPGGMVKKGEIVTAVIVRTAKEVRRRDGSYIRFGENAAVIIKPDGEPMGTRIFGPIAREVRQSGYGKIASLAPEVV